jgi:hypothetical protein
MGKKTNKPAAVAAKVDPVLPFTEVEIDGKTYKCAFSYKALAKSESFLISRGHTDANLLYRLPHLTFDNVRVIFACSLVPYQPDMDFEAAMELVTPGNIFGIIEKMLKAWGAAMPEPEKGERPPEPGANE